MAPVTPAVPPRMAASPEQWQRELVGRNIVRARQDRGLSQAQLAEQLGIDRTQLSTWENARKLPSVVALLAISGATGHNHDLGWFYTDHGTDGA